MPETLLSDYDLGGLTGKRGRDANKVKAAIPKSIDGKVRDAAAELVAFAYERGKAKGSITLTWDNGPHRKLTVTQNGQSHAVAGMVVR